MSFTAQQVAAHNARVAAGQRKNFRGGGFQILQASPAAHTGFPAALIHYSPGENDAIRQHYCGNVNLRALALQLGRSRVSVALQASRLGLGNPHRKKSSECRKAMSETRKGKQPKFKVNEVFQGERHPKGMLGKHHSQDSKDAISKANSGSSVPPERTLRSMKTRLKRYGKLAHPRIASWKSAWVTVGGQRFYARSRWEANYARYLEFQKEHGLISAWEHEPETFWFEKIKRGVRSYLPDFKVTQASGAIEYHEVKGWMDSRSKTKIKRMKKYFPSVVLVVIDSARYRTLSQQLKSIIPGWE